VNVTGPLALQAATPVSCSIAAEFTVTRTFAGANNCRGCLVLNRWPPASSTRILVGAPLPPRKPQVARRWANPTSTVDQGHRCARALLTAWRGRAFEGGVGGFIEAAARPGRARREQSPAVAVGTRRNKLPARSRSDASAPGRA